MSRIFTMVMWTGKAATFVMGLAVALSVALAVAAGTAEAAKTRSLKAGVDNAVKATTSMVGSVAGPVLRLDNNSTAIGATALDLQVEPGKTPMTVNSNARVNNLNADSLDGLDSTKFVGATAPVKVVASGHITGDGRILEATSNVGSVQITQEGIFRIDLVGITYDHIRSVGIATASPNRHVAHTSSIGGDLQVITEDVSDGFDSATFTFVIYDVS